MAIRKTATVTVAMLAAVAWGWVLWDRFLRPPAQSEWLPSGGERHKAAAGASGCAYHLPLAPSFQSVPVLHDGALYLTTATTTVAVSATSCQELWRYTRIPRSKVGWPNNRGATVSGGVVYRGTQDGFLLALDARRGKKLWERRVADIRRRETIAVAPIVWDSLVFIAPAGSELAIQGWVGAYRVRDGREVWRRSLIEPTTWAADGDLVTGGGGVWGVLGFDTTTSTLMVPTGNPVPAFAGDLRRGTNLYTNSVLAIDARTGSVRWYRQFVPNDSHDRGMTHARVIGKRVIAAGKDGVVRGLDLLTGEELFSTAVGRVDRPALPPTTRGTYGCPGIYGGVMWNAPATSRDGRIVYVPSVELCGTFIRFPRVRYLPGISYTGGVFSGDAQTWGGWLTAIDVESGITKWRYHDRDPMIGGVTVANDTVFAGTMNGGVVALEARMGREIGRLPVSGVVGGGLVTYVIDSVRYVAVAHGAGSFMFPGAQRGTPTLSVFSVPKSLIGIHRDSQP